MRRRWIAALVVILAAGALALIFGGQMGALTQAQLTQAIYLVLWLVLLAGGVAGARARLGAHWLRNAALWLAIALALMGLYLFKENFAALLARR